MNNPKEIQILFSTPMVQAKLAGRKTQTRRTMRPQPVKNGLFYEWAGAGWSNEGPITPVLGHSLSEKCPYGRPGDILWVKEEHYAHGWWVKNGFTKDGKQKWKFNDFTFDHGNKYHFSDCPPAEIISGRPERKMGWYKRNSLFMPKEAARIWLLVNSIRVERLQDISTADAKAEGMAAITKDGKLIKYGIPDKDGLPGGYKPGSGWAWSDFEVDPRDAFKKLWESINGPETWRSDPWVWVVEFEVLSISGRRSN